MAPPEEGYTYTDERTFTPEDVRTFADVSGDRQPRHLDADEDGRLLVHGLLTATMPTKLGGDLEVLGRSMDFHFLHPVYTGETITCEMVMDAVEERENRYDLQASVTCENEERETVLTGTVEGIVWK